MLRSAVVGAALLSLAACATPTTGIAPVDSSAVELERAEQRRLLLAQYRADAQRLYDMVGPLFEAARDICAADKVGPTFGLFDVDTAEMVGKDFRAAARDELGVTDGLVVTFLQPGSPLAEAGVEVGDMVVAFRGKTLTTGRRGYRDFFSQYRALKDTAPVALTVLHGGRQRDVMVNPRLLPKLALHYNPFESDVNAYADGESLNINRGLIRSITSDDALRMVLAHELAHNCQRHIDAKKTNAAIGAVFDVLAAAGGGNTNGAFAKMGGNMYSQDFEREADYVGLYYLARAGQPLDKARDAFRLLSVETGGGVNAAYGASHPSNPERFIRLQATQAEITAKASQGSPLVPENKK